MQDNEIKSQPHKNCYLCNSQGELLYQGLKDRHYSAPGIWNLRRCVNPSCGLAWLDPRPLKEETVKMYSSYFTHEDETQEEAYMDENKDHGILMTLYAASKSFLFTLSGYNKSRQQRDDMYLDKEKPGKILDIGCGTGSFLNRIRMRGWSVEGTELDAQAVINAKKIYSLNIHQGDLDDIILPENYYDAVTMSHVIEHVPDPIGAINKCRSILKPGGVLVLITPNINSLGHRIYKSNSLLLDPPRHLYIFSKKTLEKIATKAGFTSITTLTNATGNLAGLVGSQEIEKYGHYHIGETPTIFSYIKPLFLQLYEILAFKYNPGIGEELVLIARKNEK